MADFDAWYLCLGGTGGSTTTDDPLAPVAGTTAEDSAAVPDTAAVAIDIQSSRSATRCSLPGIYLWGSFQWRRFSACYDEGTLADAIHHRHDTSSV